MNRCNYAWGEGGHTSIELALYWLSMLHEDDDNETSLLYIALVHTYSAKEIPSQCLLYHERKSLHLFIRVIAPVNLEALLLISRRAYRVF